MMAKTLATGGPSATALADDAVRAILRTQYDGLAAVRIDSPPGAGKTGVVQRLAVQSLALLGERCMVVTQTNEQAFDLARRCCADFPKLRFVLFLRKDLAVPSDLPFLGNLMIVRDTKSLPQAGPCVVIANAARWSWLDADSGIDLFDLQLVDEAFQMPDYRFHQIAWMARRVVLVGDPGQIEPVVTCEIDRWRADPAGPHIASPIALVARHPGIARMALPVSRRLVPDTVSIVQPAFYPRLPFTAMSSHGARAIRAATPAVHRSDAPIARIERGASIVQVELPEAITGEVDDEIADAIVASIHRLVLRRITIIDGSAVALTPAMIGVVCAHVSQVNAVRERLPGSMSDVLVETSDRFQGLERAVMLVYHPLAGRTDADAFHLDAGRLCVMLSRHRVACIVFARVGIEDLLLRYGPSGDRVLGSDGDAEFEGWRAHLEIQRLLRTLGRMERI
jgi:hypothetical protein